MKKVISIMIVAASLTALLPATALAHGGHGRGYHRSAQVSVCTIEDCTYTENHEHDGVTYCAHYAGDGHSYHDTYAGNNGRHCCH